MSDIKIKRGKILIYRVFDIGSEIDLDKVEALFDQDSSKQRFKLDRKHNMSLVVSAPPVSINLGPTEIIFGNERFLGEIYAKVWHFGTLSLMYQLNIPEDTSWAELNRISVLIEKDKEIDVLARRRAKDFSTLISTAIPVSNDWVINEDYVTYFIQELEGIKEIKELYERVDVPSLILAEQPNTLSDQMKKASMDYSYQYSKDDLAIIDWNSALVIEPSGSLDVPLVIEFALNQLLEMRFYDDLLDQRLNTLYNEVASGKKGVMNNKYSKLAEEAGQIYLEIAEIVENVENSLKVVGDFYLATIFRAASTRFRFTDWQTSINEKLGNLAEVSKLLHSEVNESRNHMLEIIIIVLIMLEAGPLVFSWFKF